MLRRRTVSHELKQVVAVTGVQHISPLIVPPLIQGPDPQSEWASAKAKAKAKAKQKQKQSPTLSSGAYQNHPATEAMCQGRSDREPASRGGESRCARQIVEHGRSRTDRREISQGLALQTSVISSAPRHHDQVRARAGVERRCAEGRSVENRHRRWEIPTGKRVGAPPTSGSSPVVGTPDIRQQRRAAAAATTGHDRDQGRASAVAVVVSTSTVVRGADRFHTSS